jgi:hypothetical protein
MSRTIAESRGLAGAASPVFADFWADGMALRLMNIPCCALPVLVGRSRS